MIYYVPEWEYNFSYWKLSGRIKFMSSDTELNNPNAIFIHGKGEVRAYYKKGPRLDVLIISPPNNFIITDSLIIFEVRVTALGKPVKNAKITFYIDSNRFGSAVTESDGYALFSFVPDEEKSYTWYATAKKRGFVTGSSDELNFTFTKVRLYPSDDEILKKRPINLSALVELCGKPIKNATVSYFIDNKHVGDEKTQPSGCSTYTIQDITVGLHTWQVSVQIPGFNSIISETQNFTYFPQLSISLMDPKKNSTITEFTSPTKLQALVTSDNRPFRGAHVSFFVSEYKPPEYVGFNISDVDGFASFDLPPPRENETYWWYATASEKSSFNDTSSTWSFYYPVLPPYVEVDEIFVSKSRVDVGSEQTIGFHLRWENGSDVRGAAIRVTDDHEGVADDLGWAMFNVSSSEVGEKVWKIKDISCGGMGEFKHNDRYPKIIWDRISVELSVDDSRVNVGTTVEPEVKAFYEYDESVFNGSISYNTELYSDVVGDKKIRVENIIDNPYGLSVFRSNELTVIWDRIKLNLTIRRSRIVARARPCSRIPVGSEAKIIVDGIYEYDQKPFSGNVTLDEDLKGNIIGEKNFGVKSISDSLYDLSVFTCDQVSCIFDGIEIEQQINTATPAQIQILTTLNYTSDDKPVEDAQVKVNGVGEYIGSGRYKTTLYTFYPFLRLNTEIKLEEWETQVIEKNVNALGNIISESGLAAILGIILVRETHLADKPVKLWWLRARKGLMNNKKSLESRKAVLSIDASASADLIKKGRIQGELVKSGMMMPPDEVRASAQTPVQIDRLEYKVSVAIPSADDEMEIIGNIDSVEQADTEPVLRPGEAVEVAELTSSVYVHRRVHQYIIDLVSNLRESHHVRAGPSPGASMSLMKGGRVRAMIDGRGYVIPDDVKELAFKALRHRVELTAQAEAEEFSAERLIAEALEATPVPKGLERGG